MAVVFLFLSGYSSSQGPSPDKEHDKGDKAEQRPCAGRTCASIPSVVVNVSPTQTINDKTSSEGKEEQHNSSAEWWTAGATWTLAVITAFLTFFTGWLWYATRQLVKGSEDTAKRQLRAYLSIDGFPYVSHLDTTDNTIWWSIHPVWKNGGTTPTTSLFLNTHASLRDEKLPDNFDFPSAPGETIRMLVGANATVSASTLGIKGADLTAVQNGTKFFYIWGWAKYKDIFPDTPERITRFCVHITHVTGNPTLHFNKDTNPVEITFSFYKENNCMDEGCPQ